MAFQDLWQGAKRFFGPDNPFFHGPQEEQPQAEEPVMQTEAPVPEQPFQPQPQPVYQQPAYQQPYPPQQPQQAYQNPYQPPQPQAYQHPQPQQPVQNTQQNPFQQGYRPPQPQQNVNDPYVAPRHRRAAQHQQPQQPPQPQMPPTDANGNVVPFPGAQQPQQKSSNACVINVRSIADCRNAIGILRSNDCVIAVMDSIADQAEIRRYVDTLNGACFSLGCTMTRLSARVGVYLLAPAGMNVYTDQATTQMNSQSRAPQRPQQSFRPPQQPQGAYQPQMQQGYPQQQPAPVFSAQSPAQGYSPDMNESEYNAI